MKQEQEETESVLLKKSYAFALNVVKLSNYLVNEKREFVVSRKFLDNGTSICAKIEEARQGLDRADFLHNLVGGAKDTYRTHYWLRLLRDSGYIDEETSGSMLKDCEEIRKMLVASIKTTKVASP